MGVIVIRLLLGSRVKHVAVTMMLSVHSSIVLSAHVSRKRDSSSQRWVVLWHRCLRMARDMAIGIFRMGHVCYAWTIRLRPPLEWVSRGDGDGRLVIGSHSGEST